MNDDIGPIGFEQNLAGAARLRVDQSVGDLFLEVPGNLANTAIGLVLRELLDGPEKDLRIDALAGNLETILARLLLDLERDDAGDIETFELTEREHVVDPREDLGCELRVLQGVAGELVEIILADALVARLLGDLA